VSPPVWKLIVAQIVKNSLSFMELEEGSLPCSQEPDVCPIKINPVYIIKFYFSKIHFNLYWMCVATSTQSSWPFTAVTYC
jgi:hypothetical protein